MTTQLWTPWTPYGDMTYPPAVEAADYKDLYPEGTMQPLAFPPANDNNMPPVVALTGQAGAGKSTAARYLVERHGYTLVKFAAPLKNMMRALGLNDNQIEGDEKELPCALLCGKTPRHAMQALGTEFGRHCIGENFWVDLWMHQANQHDRVVVDDCRFPNEAAAVRRMGGDIYQIAGRGGIAGHHESERGIGLDPDVLIPNNGRVEDLYKLLDKQLARWG